MNAALHPCQHHTVHLSSAPFTDLRTHDHTPDAFALAQDASLERPVTPSAHLNTPYPSDMVAERGVLLYQERILGRICACTGDVPLPQVVEQVLGGAKTRSRDRTLQGTAEQIPDVPVLEMVEQLMTAEDRVARRNPEADRAEDWGGLTGPVLGQGC